RNPYTKPMRSLFHSTAHRLNKHLIKEIKQNQNSLEINWSSDNKAISNFNYIWLRDNCQCSQCIHPDNRQKLFLSSQVALDIKPIKVRISEELDELEITWPSSTSEVKSSDSSDNSFHKGRYPFTFLKSYISKTTASQLRFSDQKHITWDRDSIKSSKNLWVSYEEYMSSDERIFDSVEQLWNYGLIFLKNVPIEKDKITKVDLIRKVVERIGTLKATFYGELFDVKSVPGAKNIAYTSLGLGLHMDLLQGCASTNKSNVCCFSPFEPSSGSSEPEVVNLSQILALKLNHRIPRACLGGGSKNYIHFSFPIDTSKLQCLFGKFIKIVGYSILDLRNTLELPGKEKGALLE
ncbi:15494_t:CDS:2, partial [Dentiscutata heterogama]